MVAVVLVLCFFPGTAVTMLLKPKRAMAASLREQCILVDEREWMCLGLKRMYVDERKAGSGCWMDCWMMEKEELLERCVYLPLYIAEVGLHAHRLAELR